MSERTWLLRDAITRLLSDAPLAPATWLSVARRTAVVVACFAAGVLVGDLQAGVLAAFGALQIALVEIAVPLRPLLRLTILIFLASTVSVLIGLVVGGTWWAVAFAFFLAYVFGATAGISPTAMTVGVSALALGVIFAGMPAASPTQAIEHTGLVAFGLVVQGLAWLAFWRPERRWFVRRALANKIRTEVRILRTSSMDVTALIRTHAQVDVAETALTNARFPVDEDHRYRSVLSASISMTSALTAWIVLESPSEADRITVGVALESQVARLDGFRRRGQTRDLPADAHISAGVRAAYARLARAVDACVGDGQPTTDQLVASARASAIQQTPSGAAWKALWPSGPSRHGLRMAIGVAIAEALTLTLPINHSFWLPLTVVFTLRPDWSFTVIRGLTRTVGNLGAVLVLPALLLALGGHMFGLAIVLAALTAVTFRNFFGNYTVASFGLAGSVLILDYTLNPDPELFAIRIIATILGSLLSFAIALALPEWSSKEGPAKVAALADAITRWRAMLSAPDAHLSLYDHAPSSTILTARRALVALDPIATGALLEPRRQSRSIEIAVVLSAGTHEVAALLAVTTAALSTPVLSPTRLTEACDRARLPQSSAAFDRAVAAFQRA